MTFVKMARELAAMTTPPKFSDEAIGRIDAGRQIARELINELRAGDEGADVLASMAILVGRGHSETLRGFYRELQASLTNSVQV